MFSDPLTNLKQFGLKSTDHVADFGAGSGAYTIPAARMVRGGKVYAVEVQKDFLPRIKSEAEKEHLSNVETLWGDIENIGGTKIKEATMDAVILSSVLFQVGNKRGLVDETKRILKTGGRVLLIDWKDSFGGMGPRGDMIILKDTAKTLFENSGFKYDHDISVGEHHYGMIFKRT